MFAQLLAGSHSRAMAAPADAAEIMADLKAAFGDSVVLCVHVDDTGAPLAPGGPSHRCDDNCPLCQFAAHAAALPAPGNSALPALVGVASETLAAAPDFEAPKLSPTGFARPRAPPLEV